MWQEEPKGRETHLAHIKVLINTKLYIRNLSVATYIRRSFLAVILDIANNLSSTGKLWTSLLPQASTMEATQNMVKNLT